MTRTGMARWQPHAKAVREFSGMTQPLGQREMSLSAYVRTYGSTRWSASQTHDPHQYAQMVRAKHLSPLRTRCMTRTGIARWQPQAKSRAGIDRHETTLGAANSQPLRASSPLSGNSARRRQTTHVSCDAGRIFAVGTAMKQRLGDPPKCLCSYS